MGAGGEGSGPPGTAARDKGATVDGWPPWVPGPGGPRLYVGGALLTPRVGVVNAAGKQTVSVRWGYGRTAGSGERKKEEIAMIVGSTMSDPDDKSIIVVITVVLNSPDHMPTGARIGQTVRRMSSTAWSLSYSLPSGC